MSSKKTVVNLANNLNHLMKLFSLSRKQLSIKSGVSARMIAYICNGERTTTIDTADSIAKVFGLEGWHLIMPNLPKDIKETKHLNELINNYTEATKEGKQLIDMVAEREAKYAHE